MTTDARTRIQPPAPDAGTASPPRAGRRSLLALRVVAVLHAVVMLAQPVLAGRYLDGAVDAIALHRENATVVAVLDAAQLICAVVFAWKGRGRRWPIWASLAVAVGVEVQVGFGSASLLVVHVPLGVSLIVAQVVTVVWLFRDATTIARPVRRRRTAADPVGGERA